MVYRTKSVYKVGEIARDGRMGDAAVEVEKTMEHRYVNFKTCIVSRPQFVDPW